MNKIITIFILTSLALLVSCGGEKEEEKTETVKIEISSDQEEEIEEAAENLKDAIKQLNEASSNGNNSGEDVELVSFRELKKMFPSSVNGLDRTSNTGETTKVMGFGLSNAKAVYEEDRERIDMSITDVGGIKMALTAMAAWTMTEIDRESDTGFERTTTYEGYKAYEKFNEKSQTGEITVLVGDRFIVTTSGTNVSMDMIKDALDEIDLDDLEDKVE